MPRIRGWVILHILILFFVFLHADATRGDGPVKPTSVNFSRDVLPILSEHCFACHGPDEKARKAKLRLDIREGLYGAGRSGEPAVVPGKPEASELIHRISASEPQRLMPPPKFGKPLKPEQIEMLRRWIASGAEHRQHWAFVPPARPEVPNLQVPPGWTIRNPIDAFVLAKLQEIALTPNPEADPVTLIRRVTLDLTGLPPTPEEVAAYLADRSPTAYEKVVDRLLASPRYGEHRARYWLDAARYGDTHGLHLDNYREIWPYRDWVIRAFNENKPYDQFIVEQIAGDMLPNATLDQKVASGFNRCHVTTSEGGSIAEEVYVRNVVDRVDTLGTVFLGLTVGCARCHDHKYDPLTQKDYYALFAYFNSLDASPLDGNSARYAPIARVAPPEQLAQLETLQKEIERLQQAIRKLVAEHPYQFTASETPSYAAASIASAAGRTAYHSTHGYDQLADWLEVQKILGAAGLPPAITPLITLAADKRSPAQTKQLRDYFVENRFAPTRQVLRGLQAELRAAESAYQKADQAIPTTLISQELANPRPSYILNRGEYDQRKDQVERAPPRFLPPLPANVPNNRLGFAYWLVSPNQPLTSRVAVNQFWQSIFGTGLVRTADDFGTQGEPPTHPELLDWLAVEFRESGWNVKQLLKLIVTSSTYRQSARCTPEKLARDPSNRFLSRGPRFRLDGEALRDQALFISGLLVEKIGGPSVKPPQPAGLWEAVGYTSSNTARFTPDTGRDKVHRRSLYTFWKRTAPPPQMSVTDAPSREACVVRRERTNTPLQALLLMNEDQFVEAARYFAETTLKSTPPDADARLTAMFQRATLRSPRAGELAELRSLLDQEWARFRTLPDRAKQLIAIGETKPDPKLDPSELAAYTLVGNVLLNLDEVLNK
jgi:tetratricopeptide (TPR) repeat protein